MCHHPLSLRLLGRAKVRIDDDRVRISFRALGACYVVWRCEDVYRFEIFRTTVKFVTLFAIEQYNILRE